MKQHRVRTLMWIIALIGASILVLWPLLRPGFFTTDDGDWMVIRLTAFYQSLREGQFPVRFLGRLNNSYGYPVANFLYPGFLYIGSLLHGLGLSFVVAVKVIIASAIVGTAIAIFLWLRRRYDALASYMGALSFLFSPYVLFDIYHRGSVGEVLAFLPAAFAWYFLESNKRWLFGLALGLLIVSHNSLALLFIISLAAYGVFLKRYHFIIPTLLGLAAASFFWYPAIIEKQLVRFDAIQIANPREYFVGINNIGLLGPTCLVALALGIKKAWKKRTDMGFFLSLYAISIFFTTMLSSFAWTHSSIGALIQFPYRFLSLGVIIGPWLVAYMVSSFRSHRRFIVGGLLVCWLISLWFGQRSIVYVHRPEGYYSTNEATTTVAAEYMPKWVADIPQTRAPTKVEFYRGRGEITMTSTSTQHITAAALAQEDSVLRINTIYYPGWGVTVDGHPVALSYDNPQGLMHVPVAAGTHTIEAEFRETVTRFIIDIISVGALVAMGVFGIREHIHKATVKQHERYNGSFI